MLKKKKENYKAFTHFRIDYDSMVAPACRHDFIEDETFVTKDMAKVTCEVCLNLALSTTTVKILEELLRPENGEYH